MKKWMIVFGEQGTGPQINDFIQIDRGYQGSWATCIAGENSWAIQEPPSCANGASYAAKGDRGTVRNMVEYAPGKLHVDFVV
mgnify:CR=1 FL=1